MCNLDLIQFIFCRTAVHVGEVQLNSSSSKLRPSLKTASFSADVRYLDQSGKAVTCLPGPTRDFNNGSYIIALKRPRFHSFVLRREKLFEQACRKSRYRSSLRSGGKPQRQSWGYMSERNVVPVINQNVLKTVAARLHHVHETARRDYCCLT